jgi:hypothetical protein
MKINWLIGARNLVLGFMICFIISAADAVIAQEVKAVGCFSNVQSNGEHADGYSVELWISGGKIIGFVDHHRGLVGDPPMGILSNVQYDSRTGRISFEAKISDGVHLDNELRQTPSHDLISFDGFLKSDRLQGDIMLKGNVDSKPVVYDKRAAFIMRKYSNCGLETYENHDRWWGYWGPIYRSRGARW